MIRMIFLLGILASPAAAPVRDPVPTVTIGDPVTLARTVTLVPPLQTARPAARLTILWRTDVRLPAGLVITRADVIGYAPIYLTASDGRCFRLDLRVTASVLNAIDVTPGACTPGPPDGVAVPAVPPPPRSGLRYVGRAWDMIAWSDPHTRRTTLVRARSSGARPIIMTDMRVIGVGGLGLPDAPITDVTLVGYVRNSLMVTTVRLITP